MTEKVIVPQFVAEWYEENKEELESKIVDVLRSCNHLIDLHDEFAWWVYGLDNSIETLFKMKFFGYEIKKEKRYKVFNKAIQCYLYGVSGNIYTIRDYNSDIKGYFFTKEQLKNFNGFNLFESEEWLIEEVE